MPVLLTKNQHEQEKTFVKHMTKDPWWKQDIQMLRKDTGKIVIGTQDLLRRHGNRLICPKCERGAYRYGKKDMARCNMCGWQGRSLTVDEYIAVKMYK